jgi:AmmeMemoRadiSam system protein B
MRTDGRGVRSYYNGGRRSVKETAMLPRLRTDIDVMPSPIPERPGLLLRDPFGYTDTVLVLPHPWIALLSCLDGAHTELEAQALLTRLSGGVLVGAERVRELLELLREEGFLETDELRARKESKHEAFRAAAVREASHFGTAYPDTAPGIHERFAPEMVPSEEGKAPLPRAIAAPHVSPEGGFGSYSAAYAVEADGNEPTFVILGTSHYGKPERFGLTRKPFRTPLGTAAVDEELHDFLVSRAADAVVEEDYCHAREHAVEFQVLFLQYAMGRPIRILPVLCGPFVESLTTGRPPESREGNRRFFDALGEIAASRSDLVWVLGVDMAHIGRRYGHSESVRADEGVMLDVRERDLERLDRVCAGDAPGFFELVHPDSDPLNWCGYPPLYTFLRSAAPALNLEGELLRYEQWNIDEASVVSFAAMHFRPRSAGAA